MIQEQLHEDLKSALRAGDKPRLRTIRSLSAALKDREIEGRTKGAGQLSDEDASQVLQKQAKQRRDSIEQFEQANRPDLVAKEQEELAIIEEYLPKQLSDDEIRTVISEVIGETGAESQKDLGKVMGPSVERTRGRADGKRVNQIARELLAARG